ncbi:MAG: serine/threonine-protein phosphatase [Phycisphaerae bacterium]|nr:serine/threonine-protein phosphatase [Phycisphaerae bacterium]
MSIQTTTEPVELLIVSNGCSLPASVATLLDSGEVRATTIARLSDLGEGGVPSSLDAALIVNTEASGEGRAAIDCEADRLAERLGRGRVGVILMTSDPDQPSHLSTEVLDRIAPETSAEELRGRLAMMARYRPLIEELDRELSNMQRLGKKLNRHFTEIDQEMRLASRLQQDFLPHNLPNVSGISVSTVYRPASWVSGDIYDIARVDEKHIAMYVADAVGHGMAAALLTMFIKRAIVPKRVHSQDYEILTPGEVLTHLNDSLHSQNLPNCQFVTACYCLFNVETRQLQVSRGGHPYPIRIGVDGSLSEIRSNGGLLGLFGGEKFETVSTSLAPGEKLLLYSDGIEMAFLEQRDTDGGEPRYKHEFHSVAHLPGNELVERLTGMLDAEEGSLNPHDDVTVIVMEIPK